MRTILQTEFCSLSRGRIHRVNLPGSQARTLSPPGWMLMLNLDREYRIFNPLSRISIEHVRPLENRQDCAVLEPFFVQELHGHVLHPSGSWTTRPCLPEIRRRCVWTVVSRVTHAPWPYVFRLIYRDGSSVALDAHLGVMTLNESERRTELRLVLGGNPPGDRPYLVNRSGSLLVALRTWGEGNRFRVFEVDLEKGTQEEVESLGNASLFLNDCSSFCMEFNAGSCLTGIMPNHVYFTDYVDEKKNWKKNRKSYSMDNGKVETCFDPTSRPYASQWFQPGF